MANYPAHGSANWDSPLKGYIDAQDGDVRAEVNDLYDRLDEIDGVSFGGLTLSAGSPVVPELSNVNEWTVSDAVQVDLPAVNPGSQYTVHVKSGFQNLTWPNGTTVYGETDQQDVWVTLIRGDAGWNVLIPSPAADPSAAGLDTGWVTLAAGIDFTGTVTWSVDPGTSLGTGWGLAPAPSLLMCRIRRINNTMYVEIEGLCRKTAEATVMALYLPEGIVAESNQNFAFPVIGHTVPAATPLPRLPLVATYSGNSRYFKFTTPEGLPVPVDTVIGTPAYGAALLSFPIDPASTWGT